jgi:arginine-tRNA-protein transferase
MGSSKSEFSDIVIIDETEPCPYLADETARMPLCMPLAKITPAQADLRLKRGYRRTGEFLYQTNCPNCKACESIRIDVNAFTFSRNARRVLNRGDRRFMQIVGELQADSERVALFNKHRRARGLAKRDTDIDMEEYIWGFVRSCLDSFEISYRFNDELIAVAICDLGQKSLSAVYTYYDPEFPKDSIGTYSVLKQLEFCAARRIEYLYLGYYVEDSPHMVYKSRFVPHERLIDGEWIRFEAPT